MSGPDWPSSTTSLAADPLSIPPHNFKERRPWQMSWSLPRCQCFPLCTTGDVLNLYRRLPTPVQNRSSPWFRYLTRVYGDENIPLPFDLSHLEVWYPGLLPTSTHLCKENPWVPFIQTASNQLLPSCSAQKCAGWLRDEEEVQNDTHVRRRYYPGWARGSSHIWTPITEFWKPSSEVELHDLATSPVNKSRLILTGRHLFVGFQRPPRDRAFTADNAWVEVMHISMGSGWPEGGECKGSSETKDRAPKSS